MRVLANMAGGSHAYGLSTPTSDYDERYVFMHTDIGNIVGLDRNTFVDKRNDTEDSFGYELRHFFESLKKTNTQALEILYNDGSKFVTLHPLFKELVIANRSEFVDEAKYYSSLRGYMQNERRLANGERIGKLGGARREAIDTYGFSYKNFVQLFRLAWAGSTFFSKGYFPVNVRDEDPKFADFLMEVKTEPQKFTKEELNEHVDRWEVILEGVFTREFESRKLKVFNDDLANEVLMDFYYPMLGSIYADRKLNRKAQID